MTDINPDNPDGELPELEPLHKVLPAGGPLIPGHPNYPTPYTECQHCKARSPVGRSQVHMNGCPLIGGAK